MHHHTHVRTGAQMTNQLRRMLREVARPRLGSYLSTYHSADIASAYPHLEPEERTILWKSMGPEKAARVLSQCSEEIQVSFLSEADPSLVNQTVSLMEPDDAADFVGLAPEDRRDEILGALSKEATRKVEQLLTYPEDVAGGIMNTEFIAFPDTVTAGEAITALRESPPRQIFYNIYVLDKDGRLDGWCTWQQLVLADPDSRLPELIPATCPSVDVYTPQEEVARLVAKYDIAAIPVVDIDGRLVGRITNDDVIDVMAEEASEDLMRVAGGSEEELHQPTVIKSVGARMPWLAATFCVGILNAKFLNSQEAALRETVALAFYIPITMAMGGNFGLQTSTMTIRRLALGETDWGGLTMELWREVRVGILMGALFAIVLGAVAAFSGQGVANLGFVVGAAMLIAVTSSALIGAAIPILFDKMSVDPAVAGSPIVTSLNDMFALAIYFGFAHIMLNQ